MKRCLAILVLLGAVWLAVLAMGVTLFLTEDFTHHSQGTLSPRTGRTVDVYQFVDEFFLKLPDGTNLTADKFALYLDADTAHFLVQSGVTRVKHTGDVFTVELAQEAQWDLTSGARLRMQPSAQFTLRQDGQCLHLSDFQGVALKANLLTGWMDVETVDFCRDAQSRTVVTVKLSLLVFSVSRSVTLGADGMPVSAPDTP